MLPIILTANSAAIGLAGQGEGLKRRHALLTEAGVVPVSVTPDAALDGLKLLFVAGLDADGSEVLAMRARRAGILVNVEDVPALCDFHVPAILRRGELMFGVSTGGRAPALASRLRQWLGERFGPEWTAYTADLGAARENWRRDGIPAAEIAARTRRLVAENGWLA